MMKILIILASFQKTGAISGVDFSWISFITKEAAGIPAAPFVI
jgi:hypothetical protein